MLAITTKYMPPANSRGPRVKASYAGNSVVLPWDYGLDIVSNHMQAAQALERKMAANPNGLGLGRKFYNYVGGATGNGPYTWIALETALHKFTG